LRFLGMSAELLTATARLAARIAEKLDPTFGG
jgi:hypothetical protein